VEEERQDEGEKKMFNHGVFSPINSCLFLLHLHYSSPSSTTTAMQGSSMSRFSEIAIPNQTMWLKPVSLAYNLFSFES